MSDKILFNESQARAACDVMQTFAKAHGTGATDTHQRAAVLAILSIMTGRLRGVPEVYRGLIGDVELYGETAKAVAAEEAAGETLEPGYVAVAITEYERWTMILEGLTFDAENRNLSISEDACVLLRDVDADFPEAGIYVTYASAGSMVEQAIKDAGDPDTITGKIVAERMAADAGFPDDDTKDESEDENGDIENGSDKSDPKIDFSEYGMDALKEFAENNDVDVKGLNSKAAIIARLREFGF